MPSSKIPEMKILRVSIPKVSLWGGSREKITPSIRRAVWEKRFGSKERALCYCCKKNWIYNRIGGFECGHRRSLAGGGSNKPSNLEPICSQCNKMMQNYDLEPWCRKHREVLKTEKAKKTTAKKKLKSKPKTKKTVKKRTISRKK